MITISPPAAGSVAAAHDAKTIVLPCDIVIAGVVRREIVIQPPTVADMVAASDQAAGSQAMNEVILIANAIRVAPADVLALQSWVYRLLQGEMMGFQLPPVPTSAARP